MKTKVLMVLFIFAAVSLSAEWREDGYRDGDWNHSAPGHGYAMTPAGQEQFLTDYPGIKTFIDEKKAAGATILDVGLERIWGNGVVGEVVVNEVNTITLYHVNTKTGAVISERKPSGMGWEW